MSVRTGHRRLAVAVLAALPLALATSPTAATSAPTIGWVRLAHLSPDTPSVDVYLYAFGEPQAQVVLEHVGYGALSPYQRLDPGRYTVAMRGDGADPDSPPVISTTVDVGAGEAFTVAGMGRTASLKIQILADELSTPPGMATLRVIQASLQSPQVDVTSDDGTIAQGLRFPAFTSYEPVAPGATTLRVEGASSQASLLVAFEPASIHTLVVLDQPSGDLRLLDLVDASGTTKTPIGGVNTGGGGTAPGQSPALPAVTLWLVATVLCAAFVGAVAVATVRGCHR